MKRRPRISIVVPVYNAETYIGKCLDSILSQPYNDYEILLIDDGSCDLSGAILDDYTNKDSRIRVFHKKNGGVSSARNLGLDNSNGDYITFVDADDYLLPNTITNNLFQNGIAINSDIIEFPYIRENHIFSIDNVKLDGIKFERFYSVHFHNELWGRFYKNSIIGNIRFDQSLSIGEDVLFVCQVLSGCKTVYFNKEGGYYYNVNEGSVMRKADDEKLDSQRFALLNAFISNGMMNNARVIEFYFRLYDILKGRNDEFRMYLKKNGIISIRQLYKTGFPFKKKIKYFLSVL